MHWLVVIYDLWPDYVPQPELGKNILEKNNIEYIANILANIFYYCLRPWQ